MVKLQPQTPSSDVVNVFREHVLYMIQFAYQHGGSSTTDCEHQADVMLCTDFKSTGTNLFPQEKMQKP